MSNDVGAFFDKIWGTGDGYRCVVSQGSGGFYHEWSQSNDIYKNVEGGTNKFFAMFVFAAESRKQVSASTTRAFWVDIDVKPDVDDGSCYNTIEDAAKALKDFIDSAAFIPPTYVVRSGAGLHVYWCLDEDIDSSTWKKKAVKIKELFEAVGLRQDPSRTADSASILRVPGTINKKPGRQELPVEILSERGVISADNFFKNIDTALRVRGLNKPVLKESKLEVLRGSMLAVASRDDDKYDANTMASNCAQIGRFRAKKGEVPEPLWYAAIQVLRFTKDGARYIHKWSSGDPRYDKSATDIKIAQLDAKDIGPTTCEQMSRVGAPTLCKECAFKGRITSPIQAAVKIEEISEKKETFEFNGVEVTKGFVPKGFFLTSVGALAFKHPETGMAVDFYPYPLFVNKRVLNNTGVYHISIDTWLPRDGYTQITLPMAICKDQNTLTEELSTYGVVCNDSEDKMLRMYIIESIRQLTKDMAAVRGYSAYGWSNNVFYLHDEAHGENGLLEAVYTGDNKLCDKKGTVAEWDSVFEHYENASLTYKAAFYSGFAAPLMEFTGLGGLTYSMVSGESGVGKTTVQSVVCAIYGDPDTMRAQRTDTYNSLMKRLGVLNNLPLCVDEMTNIEGEHLSEFIYQVSQGREKSRLTQAASMQSSGRWRTLVVSSSNELLSEKIRANRADSEAELARLVELYAPTYAPKVALDRINRTVRSNYGVIGEIWASYIAKHQTRIKSIIEALTKQIESISGWGSQGRYHTAFVALTATSVALLNKLFGREVDMDEYISAVIAEINNSTRATTENTSKYHIDEQSLSKYSESDSNGVRQELATRMKSAEASEVRWLEAVVRAIMPNAVVKNGKKVTEPRNEVDGVIDEQAGVLYLPCGLANKLAAKAGVSAMPFASMQKRRVPTYDGTSYASTSIFMCYVVDITPIQNKIRVVKEANNINTDSDLKGVFNVS